jgi:hypothetical protein
MKDSSEYLKCPKCSQSNTVDFWDRHTKQEVGIKDTDTFVSAGADKKVHDEVQSYYHCPICNEEVDGIDLNK